MFTHKLFFWSSRGLGIFILMFSLNIFGSEHEKAEGKGGEKKEEKKEEKGKGEEKKVPPGVD